MSQAPIMPFYTDAYLADTRHLTTEAHGAYLLLLLYSWRNNGAPPPDDDRLLARITGLQLRRWQQVLRPLLEPFYRIEGGLWHQKRLEATWAEVQQRIEKQRQKGVKGNWARSRHAQANALIPTDSPAAAGNAQATPSMNHEPSTMNLEPLPDQPSSHIHHPAVHQVMTPALKALKPILGDVQYFLRNGKRISPAMTPQIRAAQDEAVLQLSPMGHEHAQQLTARLWRMYPPRGSDTAALRQDYESWFARLPADVGQRCVDVVMTKHAYASLPRIADFAPHALPECEHRRGVLSRVNKLAAQVGLAPAALDGS